MPRPLETITVRSISLDPSLEAPRMNIHRPEDFLDVMKDNRMVSGFAAIWIEQLYGVRMNRRSETAFEIPHPHLELRATVRCFSEGNIRFQQSSRKGVYREEQAQEDHLAFDAERVDFYFVCDAREFPRLDFYPLRSAKILNYVHSRQLTLSGLTPAQFDRFIAENYATSFPNIDEDGKVIGNRRQLGQEPQSMLAVMKEQNPGLSIGQTPR